MIKKTAVVLVFPSPKACICHVADILGYANTPKAIRDHVDDEDKLTERIVLSGQNREVIFINESGLYSLILSSKMPNTKKFKRWVTSEVLPAIRKHGVFAVDEVLANPDILINALMELKKEREEKLALRFLICYLLLLPEGSGQVDYPITSLPTIPLTYFFLGLVCDNALPATDFDVLLKRPSRRTLLALEATGREVCFVFLAMWFHLSFFYLDSIMKDLKVSKYGRYYGEGWEKVWEENR